MDFITLFDVVVVSLVLILGIKGVISGLIKEIFGLIGLIGGIVVASRFGVRVGNLISDKIYKLDGDSVLFFAGFLTTLIVFWLLCLEVPSGSFVRSCPLMAKASAVRLFGRTIASLNLLSLKLLSPEDRAARINPIISS